MNSAASMILDDRIGLAMKRTLPNVSATPVPKNQALLSKLPKAWSGREIMTTDFPPPKMSVVGLIPTGAVLLSGTFKIGKSWMILQLMNCVSRGEDFLGHAVCKGPVVYLALEDGPGRIKDRAARMGVTLSEDVTVFNSWLSGEDGIASLDAWLEEHPTRLVAIDTLSRWQDDFRGSDIWARDTKRIADLKGIADRHECTILIVHHRSKANREDIHQSVAGTNALQGAADASIILEKNRKELKGKLSVVGRDIAESELAIEFNPNSCTWIATDEDPDEALLTGERQTILDAIRKNGGTATTGAIAQAIGKSDKAVSRLLTKLKDDGQIVSVKYATYSLVSQVNTGRTDAYTGGTGRTGRTDLLRESGTSTTSTTSTTYTDDAIGEGIIF
jgi:DNA-binding transcriptional ArsR family regulator